ncbi:MAG: hypothetical protein H6682_07360 [Candidatus Eisenbacteria bacterium]|nr:hypothetical protein [Candidatus Eisenbacteria bacterium]
MSKGIRAFRSLVLAAPALVLLAVGCTDEEKVYIDKPLFEDPPESAAGFLGYDEEGQKLTVCGNCHVGQQAGWETTAHAGAWETLEASGHAQGLCENCHTAGPNGNTTDGTVGFAGTQSSRYHDVQCESCHGPGLEHVTNPDASQPIASIRVALDATNGCGECHQGAHHPFLEDWSRSPHAEPVATVINLAAGNPVEYGECLACHSGQGALEAWGVRADYLEKDDAVTDHLGITCAVCHDPHEAFNEGQLRFPVDSPNIELNLCAKCHNRRAQPEIEAASLRGPHAPEAPLLFGTAGWFPPGFEPDNRILGTHGTTGNPRMCASCHVAGYEVQDQETGQFVVTVTGHRFLAIPCVDANGIPTDDQDCETSDRIFTACANSGCHGDADAARATYTSAKARIDALVAQVDAVLADPNQVPPGERDSNDGRFTVADGAWFNARLAALPGSSTHNPYLCEALLEASLDAIEAEYGDGLRAENTRDQ